MNLTVDQILAIPAHDITDEMLDGHVGNRDRVQFLQAPFRVACQAAYEKSDLAGQLGHTHSGLISQFISRNQAAVAFRDGHPLDSNAELRRSQCDSIRVWTLGVQSFDALRQATGRPPQSNGLPPVPALPQPIPRGLDALYAYAPQTGPTPAEWIAANEERLLDTSKTRLIGSAIHIRVSAWSDEDRKLLIHFHGAAVQHLENVFERALPVFQFYG